MNTTKLLPLLFAITIISQSFSIDNNDIFTPSPFTDLKIEIEGSVLGTVVDNNGIAIEGTAVILEDKTVYTDENGIFQFNNETLFSSGTYIEIIKDGFFAGSRRFYPSAAKTSMVTVELIPKNLVAEFNNSEGRKWLLRM